MKSKLDFVHLRGVGEDVGELSVNCGWGFSAVGFQPRQWNMSVGQPQHEVRRFGHVSNFCAKSSKEEGGCHDSSGAGSGCDPAYERGGTWWSWFAPSKVRWQAAAAARQSMMRGAPAFRSRCGTWAPTGSPSSRPCGRLLDLGLREAMGMVDTGGGTGAADNDEGPETAGVPAKPRTPLPSDEAAERLAVPRRPRQEA